MFIIYLVSFIWYRIVCSILSLKITGDPVTYFFLIRSLLISPSFSFFFFFSLLPLSTLTKKSLLIFLTFCLKLYHYLIILRLVCRDTGHVCGGKEGEKTLWQLVKARLGGFPAGTWMRQQQRSLCLHRGVFKTSWTSSVSISALPGNFSQEVSFSACWGVWKERFSSR